MQFGRQVPETWNCSGRPLRPALHSVPEHSDPEYSEPDHSEQAYSAPPHSESVRVADRMSPVRGRRRPRHSAEEEAPPVALRRLMRRQAGQQLATPAKKVARAASKEQGLSQEPQTTKKLLDASTHQSFGQYPSLCAIQQRGSFQSRIGGSAFMVNQPGLQGTDFCPRRGYSSSRTQSSVLDVVCSPADTMFSSFLIHALPAPPEVWLSSCRPLISLNRSSTLSSLSRALKRSSSVSGASTSVAAALSADLS